jgi:hypothetical protein
MEMCLVPSPNTLACAREPEGACTALNILGQPPTGTNVMSEAYTAGLFDIGFSLARRLYASLSANTFDEACVKTELEALYAFVSKYETLWSSRDPDNETYKNLVALQAALRELATIEKGYVGTRVALEIVANKDRLHELGRVIRRTSVPGLTERMARDDRNMFVASIRKLSQAIARAMDDTTPSIVKAWKSMLAAKRADKATLRADVLAVLDATSRLALTDDADAATAATSAATPVAAAGGDEGVMCAAGRSSPSAEIGQSGGLKRPRV